MDVRCPQCDTLYEIDARELRGGAATFKCSQCDHVFRLQTSASLSRENQRRWMVRNTQSGDVLYFSAFDELHQWILQGKVGKSDEVSRTGQRWTKVGDIGEFMPIFQAVESISNISASQAAAQKRDQPQDEAHAKPSPDDPAGSGPAYRSKIKTSQQFKVNDTGPAGSASPAGSANQRPQTNPDLAEPSRPQRSHTPVEPARSQTPAPRPAAGQSARDAEPAQPSAPGSRSHDSGPQVRLQAGAFGDAQAAESDDHWSFGGGASLGEVESSGHYDAVEYDPGKSRWPVVLVVVLVLMVAGGAGLYFVRPDLIEAYLPSSADEDIVPIANDGHEADQQEAPEPTPPDELVASAITEAVEAARQANAEHLSEGIAAARPKLLAGVQTANEAARKAAEEPDPDEILAKAKAYLESGRPGRARTKFHKVLEDDRRNVEAITGLGWSLLALGNAGAASAQFRKALSYNAGYGNAYIGLGKAEREQGNAQAALDAYQNYLSRFPGGRKRSIAQYQADKLKKSLGQ